MSSTSTYSSEMVICLQVFMMKQRQMTTYGVQSSEKDTWMRFPTIPGYAPAQLFGLDGCRVLCFPTARLCAQRGGKDGRTLRQATSNGLLKSLIVPHYLIAMTSNLLTGA